MAQFIISAFADEASDLLEGQIAALKRNGLNMLEPRSIEGRATDWILLDYGDLIVHVFGKNAREFYALDKMWSDGTPIDIERYLVGGEDK